MTPPAPTPAEVAALAAFGGATPVRPGHWPPAAADRQRVVEPQVPAAAGWLLVGLVLLAWLERWLGARAWRRGSSSIPHDGLVRSVDR